MKLIYVCLITAFTFSIINPCVLEAQININDSLALVSLYNTTHGSNWTRNKNWLKGPVNTWYGITVQKNRVTVINLAADNLTDSLTPAIGNLTALGRLDLRSNKLTSGIPNSIGNLTFLNYLNLSNNTLKEKIPSSIGELTSLTIIDLSINLLTGSIPDSIGNLSNLTELYLHANQLNGTIPFSIGNLTNLTWLNFRANQLTGNLPSSIGNLTNLINIDASSNKLSGNIPNSITNLSNLSGLIINDNQFTGSIPDDLDKLIHLNTLELSGNKLSGSIPASIGNMKSLYSLQLNYNKLTGTIPSNICDLSGLVYLGLSNNQLTGSIPKRIGDLVNLASLSLNNNNLTGIASESISTFKNLFLLNLSHNDINGEFPFPATLIPCSFILSHNHLIENKNIMPNIYNTLGYNVSIDNNNYNFNGIEFLVERSISYFYTPQAVLHIHQHNNTISVYAGGTLSNNTYQWSKDGVIVKTIQGDSTYHPITIGNYTVKVTNSIAKKLTLYSDTFNIALLTATIKTSALKTLVNSFSVYPNPANAITTITFNAAANGSINLTNASGNLLQTIEVPRGSNTVSLDVSKYAKGIYFVSFIDDNKQTQTLKLIKE